jgi:hypothetical protein
MESSLAVSGEPLLSPSPPSSDDLPGYNSLFPTTVIETLGTQAYVSVNGLLYFIRGLGALWGSPIGGALVGKGAAPREYIKLIWYDFALLMLSSVCVMAVRGFDAKEKGRFKLKA